MILRVLTLVSVLLLTATPALACPQCAMKDKAGLGSWFVLAGMILFPFVVTGGVLFAFRKMHLLGDPQ